MQYFHIMTMVNKIHNSKSQKNDPPWNCQKSTPQKNGWIFLESDEFPQLGANFCPSSGAWLLLAVRFRVTGFLPVFLVHLQLAMKAQEQSFSQDFRLKECLQRRFGWQTRWVKHLMTNFQPWKIPMGFVVVFFKNGIYISTVSIYKNPCIII